jgi:multicomponent Na+:H+ antiporter subunit D
VPDLVASIERAAAHFRDHTAYTAAVLAGHAPSYPHVPTAHVEPSAWIYGIASLVGAFGLAAVGLRGREVVPGGIGNALRAAHSGHIGDYVAWWTFGITVLGGLVLWAVTG